MRKARFYPATRALPIPRLQQESWRQVHSSSSWSWPWRSEDALGEEELSQRGGLGRNVGDRLEFGRHELARLLKLGAVVDGDGRRASMLGGLRQWQVEFFNLLNLPP